MRICCMCVSELDSVTNWYVVNRQRPDQIMPPPPPEQIQFNSSVNTDYEEESLHSGSQLYLSGPKIKKRKAKIGRNATLAMQDFCYRIQTWDKE